MEGKGKVTLTPVDVEAKDEVMLKELMTIRRHVNGIRNMMIVIMIFLIGSAVLFACSAMWAWLAVPIY